METKQLYSDIKGLRTGFNREMANIPKKVHDSVFRFDDLTPEVQVAELAKGKAGVNDSYKARVANLQARIVDDKQDTLQGIGKIRHPAISSKDNVTRALGETQVNSAYLFLSTPHSTQTIVSTVRDAFNLGRYDFAFTVMDGAKNGIPRDPAGEPFPSDAQKQMLAEFEALEGSIPDAAKIGELDTEMQTLTKLEMIANDFERQLNSGYDMLVSADLWPSLSEAERNESIAAVDARKNITDVVFFKRRVSEVMAKSAS